MSGMPIWLRAHADSLARRALELKRAIQKKLRDAQPAAKAS